eukprot:5777925-Amphidinium_carterae.1
MSRFDIAFLGLLGPACTLQEFDTECAIAFNFALHECRARVIRTNTFAAHLLRLFWDLQRTQS